MEALSSAVRATRTMADPPPSMLTLRVAGTVSVSAVSVLAGASLLKPCPGEKGMGVALPDKLSMAAAATLAALYGPSQPDPGARSK